MTYTVKKTKVSKTEGLTTPILASKIAFVFPQDWKLSQIPYLIQFNNATPLGANMSSSLLTCLRKGGMFDMRKSFWTKPRLEAVSKMLLTLAQGFLIACGAGNLLERMTSVFITLLYFVAVFALTFVGIFFADVKLKEV